MKNCFVVLLFFANFLIWSQTNNDKVINGKIYADSSPLDKIEIVNLGNEKVTVTNNKGEFSILAKANDILVFSSMTLEMKRMLVDDDDLKSELIIIYMNPKINELNEVIVKKNVAEGISIIPGRKRYTPAERKLFTATSGILVAPINWLSGRTEMLKKEIIVEKKERMLNKVGVLYEDKYYIKTLKVPEIYIDDFQRYIIEDKEFAAALKVKNRTMMLFLITKLAVNYNAIPK